MGFFGEIWADAKSLVLGAPAYRSLNSLTPEQMEGIHALSEGLVRWQQNGTRQRVEQTLGKGNGDVSMPRLAGRIASFAAQDDPAWLEQERKAEARQVAGLLKRSGWLDDNGVRTGL